MDEEIDKERNSHSAAGQDREDIRAAYQSIPQMIAQESGKQWSATSVFIQFSIALIAASIVPSFIPDLNTRTSAIAGALPSGIGVVASLL